MSGSRRRWVLLAVALSPVAGLGAVATADESSPATPAAAAWYPSGVGTVAAATYPAGTLHVGAAVGQETDRTYLRFELDALPGDADVERVTITVPIDPAAGTSAPETAVVLACAVPAGFDPAAPEPAEVDCDGAPEATVDATALTVDLDATGDAVDVALVPGGGDTWHLGFDDADGDAPPVAVATYSVPPSPTTTTTRPAASVAAPSFTPPAATGSVALPPIALPPPAAVGQAIADQAAISTPSAVAAAPASSGGGFRYAAVFALPLVLLVVVGLIGDGLTRPVRLREETA